MAPQYSKQQKIGQEGESYVTHLFTDGGLIFHPISMGNDFGIDGRIEIPSKQGQILGGEFNIQVKSSNKLKSSTDGSTIKCKPLMTETAAYWHSKINPTLIVLYCHSLKKCYYEWAHVAIDGNKLISAIHKGQKTITPVIPAENVLKKDSLHLIVKEVLRLYGKVVNSLYQGRLHNDCMVLYKTASDALDILLDWLTALSLEDPRPRAIERLPKDVTDDQKRETYERAWKSRLKPSGLVTPHLPANQLYAAILMFRALLTFTVIVDNLSEEDGLKKFTTDSPLLTSSKTTLELIRKFYMDAYSEFDEGYKRGAEVALYGNPKVEKLICLSAPLEKVEKSLGLIALVIRDYQRSLRHFLFPPSPKTSPVNPFQALEYLAAKDMITATGWLPKTEGGS